MVAGRVSSSIAAELGTMRVTEQIDALTTLSTDPMKYLVLPRVLAGTHRPAAARRGRQRHRHLRRLSRRHHPARLQPRRLHQEHPRLPRPPPTSPPSLTKAAVFGFLLALMGCYHGYHSGRGAQGVGEATTNAVVSASILILAANYLLTEAFF